jgi:hypothetical protein
MSKIKNCTNCGADNDLFLTNCLYCKTPLPQVNLDSISNEELIQNTGEWIGKVGSTFTHITEKYNAWNGKGMIVISANQIEGMAQKYLSLLQARSISNNNLLIIYTDLKKEFDNKRKGILYKIGGGDKEKGSKYIIALIIIILMLLVPIVASLAM